MNMKYEDFLTLLLVLYHFEKQKDVLDKRYSKFVLFEFNMPSCLDKPNTKKLSKFLSENKKDYKLNLFDIEKEVRKFIPNQKVSIFFNFLWDYFETSKVCLLISANENTNKELPARIVFWEEEQEKFHKRDDASYSTIKQIFTGKELKKRLQYNKEQRESIVVFLNDLVFTFREEKNPILLCIDFSKSPPKEDYLEFCLYDFFENSYLNKTEILNYFIYFKDIDFSGAYNHLLTKWYNENINESVLEDESFDLPMEQVKTVLSHLKENLKKKSGINFILNTQNNSNFNKVNLLAVIFYLKINGICEIVDMQSKHESKINPVDWFKLTIHRNEFDTLCEKFHLNKTKCYRMENDDIELDENIIFRKQKKGENVLLLKRNNSTESFKYKVKISPTEANLINFLYSQKDAGKAFSLQEISEKIREEKRTLQNKQRDIFKIYETNNINPLKDILHKAKYKYQLNPELKPKL